MSVKHVDDIEASVVKGGISVSRKMLIALEEAPNFAMREFRIEPGGSMPNHTNTVRHEQYVIEGDAQVCIGEEIFFVHKGSIVFIPANIPHWYKNTGKGVFRFLCLVPNQPDTTVILE